MQEIVPGLVHWTAPHPRIGVEVSSYYLVAERVLPPPRPRRLAAARGLRCTVHCIHNGLHELEGRGPVEPFEFGDELPGGAIVFEVDAICPDETALHLPAHRALACGDGVVRRPGDDALVFVPDRFMDDPARTKAGLRDAYRRLLDLDVDLLLLAHGGPVVGGAKEALEAFADGRG